MGDLIGESVALSDDMPTCHLEGYSLFCFLERYKYVVGQEKM